MDNLRQSLISKLIISPVLVNDIPDWNALTLHMKWLKSSVDLGCI